MFNLNETTSISMHLLKGVIQVARKGTRQIGTIRQGGRDMLSFSISEGAKDMLLSYSYDGKVYSYSIPLVEVPSNLGKEQGCFFFKCPKSSHLCRKLYLYKGYFVSRKYIPGAVYDCQARGKEKDDYLRLFGSGFFSIDFTNRKEYYRGKLTPWGRKMNKAYNRYEQIYGEVSRKMDIERLMAVEAAGE